MGLLGTFKDTSPFWCESRGRTLGQFKQANAPPPPPAAAAPSSSSSYSVSVVDASQAMAKEEEDSNVFASLMPNLFNRLQQCDDSVTEQEFQAIHRLLTLPGSEDEVLKGNSFMNQPLATFLKQREKGDETEVLEGSKKQPSPLIKPVYASGKENMLLSNPLQRNKFLRRERSSRVTSHRRPFIVDIESFGSLFNNALRECKKPQDVHAFWEAADEREASEAIMRKLRGRSESCNPKSVVGNSSSRRLGVRRKNSQRMTTRLRGFAVEIPSCGENVQSLDDEQLEEEEDATEESCFTFLSNPAFRVKGVPQNQQADKQAQLSQLVKSIQSDRFHQQADKQTQLSQLVKSIQSDEVVLEIGCMNETARMRDQAEDDDDNLSDAKSLLIDSEGDGQCTFSHTKTATSEDGPNEGLRPSQASEIVEIAPSNQVVEPVTSLAAESEDRHLEKEVDVANEVNMKVTPYNRNTVTKRNPFTSPTPPLNPLAGLVLRNNNAVEGVGNRRLNFDDTMESSILDPDLPASTIQITTFLQNSSASPESSKILVQEKNLELVEDINSISFDVPSEAIKSLEQNVTKPLRKTFTKRKKTMKDRRVSLEGAGTNWDEGVRRSTRIRSRPLEWWRGERFLLGRVHKSLVTVIGIKYSSPPPCWPKRGAKASKFKVESYVPEEYAKYVQFAALC